mgnify:CR=1 FL=1
MKHNVFSFLRAYATDPFKIDQLIVTSFVRLNDINVVNNQFILQYLIDENNLDENDAVNQFIHLLSLEKKDNVFDFETLIECFEFVVSPLDKIITGAIYTPENIRNYIIDQGLTRTTFDINDLQIADISCGCGSFLFDTTKRIRQRTQRTFQEIYEQNIFGLDIQEYSIVRTKILLSLLALLEGEDIIEFHFNLFVGDALNFNWGNSLEGFEGFNFIVGNPPYVCSRNIPDDTKQYLKNWGVCSTGHPDLYIPFFEIGMENLVENGFLGFITMNTFFKSVNGRALRTYFQENRFSFTILDFGSAQIFKSKSTYTCICFIEKRESDFINYALIKADSLQSERNLNEIPYDSLDSRKGWNFQDAELVAKIESVGQPFGELYRTRNGIATLKNNVYIFDAIDEDEEYFFFGNDPVIAIEKDICREIINPNKFTRQNNIDELRRKIIFPYTIENNRAVLISEDEFRTNYPNAYQYLDSQREILSKRDKSAGKYENWFAYGRNQSLENLNHKLFFPHITPSIPHYEISNEPELLFYNGLAIVADNERELHFLKKLMSSNVFWFYVTKTSKPYGSGYYSLSRNYIKNFGVCDLTDEEKNYVIAETNMTRVNSFFNKRYGVQSKLIK